jgi:reactive intermediate/imine deaminase
MQPSQASDLILPVSVPGLSPPAGHYTPGIRAGGLVFVSGQLPIGPDGKPLADAPFEAQVHQALANVFAILAAAGSAPDRIVKTTAFIVGIDNWPRFNAIYAEAFGPHRPARSVVPVPALHHGCLVEIEAIALMSPEGPGYHPGTSRHAAAASASG